jgi:hypothetical protein
MQGSQVRIFTKEIRTLGSSAPISEAKSPECPRHRPRVLGAAVVEISNSEYEASPNKVQGEGADIHLVMPDNY